MKVQKHIEVRLLTKRLTCPVIDVVQYDTGVQLVFSLVDFDIPSGTTATLYVQKRSGKFVYQDKDITVSGNEITIDLENQALTEHGETKYQIMLKNGTDTVTTFAGVLRIEKSLADANAVESKTVVRAFDEAVADHVAEFQTKAEQIVAACIATIPDDYTTMEAKVNEQANAVKGNLSGAVVFADDVSPVEHNPVVRAHGKNLFDTSKIAVQANTDNIYISAVGEGYIDITTKEAYDGNGHCVTWVKLKELCPQMQAGKQYALSGTTTAWNKMIYLKEIDLFWSYGTRRVVTKEMLESTVGFYGLNAIREQGFGTCRISSIQCEEGYEITEYMSYIDPSTVTVKRCGTNLFDGNNVAGDVSGTYRGWLVNPEENDVIMSVTDKDTSVSITGMYLGLNENGIDANYGYVWLVEDGQLAKNNITRKYKYVSVFPKTDYAINQLMKRFNIQVERGTTATAYDATTVTTHIPTADGTVTGLTSVSPNMTIMTDTEGVIVECEYNRDTNKVIEKLTNAIIALGGTV